MSTAYHAKYFAYELTRQAPPGADDRLSMALFDASVDLNPHQIESALFALKSPLAKGVVLADEVGLGKTIEAGIVLCQYWAERRRRIVVVCPASIRKQWALELQEKFNLPSIVLDAQAYRQAQASGLPRPFESRAVVIISYHYANRMRDELRSLPWDLVVLDEAHKLRNAWKENAQLSQGIKWAFGERKKLLLTATPLQNSLMELYGLASVIDEHLFGDVNAFRSQYMTAGASLDALRGRMSSFMKRTLRRNVTEYVRYTQRKPITRPFRPTDDEHKLYEAVSAFLQQPDTYAIPHRQRHLTVLILHKLLASSSQAIAGTLDTMRARLEAIRDGNVVEEALAEKWIEEEELESDLLDEILDESEESESKEADQAPGIDFERLKFEITELKRLAEWARSIGVDTKSRTLLAALDVGFKELAQFGAGRKCLLFTESRRTQDYLKRYLEANGYAGQVVVFNGTNSGPEAQAIYQDWVEKNQGSGRLTGSRSIDARTALIEHFRDNASILIATEAAAEGVNLQFCSLVINYDLPWNPQRIEQRIGRCHRYGQKHDVVVINFLNERNQADRRVLELLTEKFHLFDGLFGSSDEVLGVIESGVDFEKRILAIYRECRTPESIEQAFRQLQQELDERIQTRMSDTRKALLEHFDEDVHQRLRLQLENTQKQLDIFSRRFWTVTQFILSQRAEFDERDYSFQLRTAPTTDIACGHYHLISRHRPGKTEKDQELDEVGGTFLYRLSHPLGEHVISKAKTVETPVAEIVFDISHHEGRISLIEALKGQSGWLTLTRLTLQSLESEEYLLFSGQDDSGRSLDAETCAKLFQCEATVKPASAAPAVTASRLAGDAQRHVKATLNQSLEANNVHFRAAREQLEQWADDQVLSAEKALKDTKESIKALQRQGRQAVTLDEQKEIQEKIARLEKQQRRQRQDIFNVEDQIIGKRDQLISALESRLTQKLETQTLFTVRWSVI